MSVIARSISDKAIQKIRFLQKNWIAALPLVARNDLSDMIEFRHIPTRT